MLNGLEAVEISFRNLNAEFRFDSEYHKKAYLKEDKQRSKYANLALGQFAFITDGQHGYHEVDDDSPLVLLTAKNAKNWFADKLGADKVAQWLDEKNKRSSLQVNDILISTRGSLGYCALVKSDVLPANIDQDVARVAICGSEVLPEFALAYLNCTVGQDWIKRNATGMVQQGLSLAKLRELPLPILSNEFQSKIKIVVCTAHRKLEQSKALYAEAENLLLDELGLTDWQPSQESVAVKSFAESFLQTGRLDAEFYQPKYDELMRLIRQNKHKQSLLSNLIEPIRNGGDYREFIEYGTPYIRVGDVRNGRINVAGAAKIATTEQDLTKNIAIKDGDVLFTRKGSFGNAAVVRASELGAIISSEIMLLRLRKELDVPVLPDYLVIYLNSKLGYMQVERKVHGVAFYSISQPDLAQVEVLLPPLPIQEFIVEKVQGSLIKERESKQLLELAKRGVEMAIEQDERAALAWMEQNGDKIQE